MRRRWCRPPPPRPGSAGDLRDGVPPMVEDRRIWLPPVRNTPVESWTARAESSSFAWVRVVAWMGVTCAAPSSVNTLRYISPASGPSDEALLMTAMRAS